MGRKNYSKFSNNKQNAVVDKVSFEEVQQMTSQIIEDKKPVIKGYVANCERLNVRKEPNTDSEVVCIINKGTEVILESIGVINGFYRVNTAHGAEGYCMEKYIEIK